MRKPFTVLAVIILTVALLLPLQAWARTWTGFDSLTITKSDGTPLTGEVTGFATMANPGFEKTITEPIPPYTIPVFLDVDTDDGDMHGPGHVEGFRFDTFVVLTNTTDGPVGVLLTLRNAAGDTVLGTKTITLNPHATGFVPLSTLL